MPTGNAETKKLKLKGQEDGRQMNRHVLISNRKCVNGFIEERKVGGNQVAD